MDLKQLLQSYQQELDQFFHKLNVNELETIFKLFLNCRGMLFFSGIGKSALVAEKIAVTMTSTGTRAIFMSPVGAMHGDIGLLTEQDLFVVISKSGETDELLNLLPYVRNKGSKIIAITSHANSRIAKAADVKLILPIEKELCPFNLAPTISTTAQTIVGDVLAVALMQERKFTLDAYAMNHPAGTIGKRITLKVRDLMMTGSQIPLCHPEDKVIDILVELSDKRAGCVLVVNSANHLEGIFTDGDLRRALQKHGGEILHSPIKNLMTKNPRMIGPDALAWDAMKLMETNQKSPVMVLPVVDDQKRILGLLKMHDILQSGI
jgi:arabinose-5-phosphate isomerase